MKKIILAALTAGMVLSLAACSRDTNDPIAATGEGTPLTGEITVGCFDTMLYEKFLNEAASLFELKHPGAKINIETFSKMPEIKTRELEDGSTVSISEGNDDQEMMDYIFRLNAQLMSGQGPDILAMDVLPYYKYAESGLLEDLRSFMDADEGFKAGAYRDNIIKNVRYKGGQYIIPLDFGYEFLSFDKNKVSSEAALKLREKNMFTYAEISGLIKDKFTADSSGARVIDFQGGAHHAFRTLFKGDYKKYVDLENKKANFKDGSFVELLNWINEQRLNGYFRPEFLSLEENSQDYIDSQALYYYKYQIDMVLKNIFVPKDDQPSSSAFPIPDIDEIAGLLTNEAGQPAFRCYQTYGMNANSKNKTLAWEFIKFMLSDEMQQSLNLLGFPVNNAAFIENSKVNMTKIPNYAPQADGEYTVDGYHELRDEKYVRAYEDYMVYHNGFVDTLSLYTTTDQIISDMVNSEVELFFGGKKSAEMVADTLQNKVFLYLNE
jgi:ABC-type glycerol-3-phosphate transport system substrate-binding protein